MTSNSADLPDPTGPTMAVSLPRGTRSVRPRRHTAGEAVAGEDADDVAAAERGAAGGILLLPAFFSSGVGVELCSLRILTSSSSSPSGQNPHTNEAWSSVHASPSSNGRCISSSSPAREAGGLEEAADSDSIPRGRQERSRDSAATPSETQTRAPPAKWPPDTEEGASQAGAAAAAAAPPPGES
jgi:hypothetical protein